MSTDDNNTMDGYPFYSCVRIHKDDVLSAAEELDIKLTDKEADEIASEIANNYVIETGFWDNVRCWLEDNYEPEETDDDDQEETADHDCNQFRKSQGEGSYDRCGHCGSLIFEDKD